MFDYQKVLRQLAKTNKWQIVYSRSSEMSGINLFLNNFDFSAIQLEFINNLAFYYSLNIDVSLGEVSEIIFKHEIYEDAYITYKHRERKKMTHNTDKIKFDKPLTDNGLKEQISSKTDWILKKARTL